MRYFAFVGILLILLAAELMPWVRDVIGWGIFALIMLVIIIPNVIPNKYFRPKNKK